MDTLTDMSTLFVYSKSTIHEIIYFLTFDERNQYLSYTNLTRYRLFISPDNYEKFFEKINNAWSNLYSDKIFYIYVIEERDLQIRLLYNTIQRDKQLFGIEINLDKKESDDINFIDKISSLIDLTLNDMYCANMCTDF